MKFLFQAFLLLVLLGGCDRSLSEHEANKADLVISNISLFDSESATVTSNQSIFIKDGVIQDIRAASENEDAHQIIAGNGRLASPGFIDAHVHFTHQFSPSRNLQEQDRDRLGHVYLTHGVTTVAEMGQPPAWVPTLTKWGDTPQATSPNVVVVAGSLNSTHNWDTSPPPHHILLASPEEAREQVRVYHAQGVEHLKLYWKLELPEMTAVIDEADKLGMNYYGHIDNGFISIQDAMTQGVRNFEHFFTIQRSVISPDPLIEMIAEDFPFEGPDSLDEWTLSLALYHQKIERTAELKAQYDALIETMIAKKATVSTSINMLAAAAGASPVYSGFDPKPPRFAPVIREGFVPDGVGEAAVEVVLTQVRRAHENGLKIRMGTDARNGGEAALAEMQLLVEAGLPVEDVLQIATRNGADALGISNRVGHLKVGRRADIVLFEKSPFEDSANFLAGVTTIKNGQVYIPRHSPADLYAERLVADGIDSARAWWDNTSDQPLHPAEFQDAIHRLIDSGHVTEARILIDLLPKMLHGETLTDYVHDEGINRAGQTLLNEGDTEAAIAVFELAVYLRPDSWVAHFNLGAVYAASEHVDDAIISFEHALTLNPENAIARSRLESLREQTIE